MSAHEKKLVVVDEAIGNELRALLRERIAEILSGPGDTVFDELVAFGERVFATGIIQGQARPHTGVVASSARASLIDLNVMAEEGVTMLVAPGQTRKGRVRNMGLLLEMVAQHVRQASAGMLQIEANGRMAVARKFPDMAAAAESSAAALRQCAELILQGYIPRELLDGMSPVKGGETPEVTVPPVAQEELFK